MNTVRRFCYLGDDGNPSPSKFWANVGYASATVAFLKIAWLAQPSDALSGLFLVYTGVMGVSQLVNRWLGAKAGNGNVGNGTSAPGTPAK